MLIVAPMMSPHGTAVGSVGGGAGTSFSVSTVAFARSVLHNGSLALFPAHSICFKNADFFAASVPATSAGTSDKKTTCFFGACRHVPSVLSGGFGMILPFVSGARR